jgi:hypothetical protein
MLLQLWETCIADLISAIFQFEGKVTFGNEAVY